MFNGYINDIVFIEFPVDLLNIKHLAKYTSLNNLVYTDGQKLGNTTHASNEMECASRCLQLSECIAFVYDKSGFELNCYALNGANKAAISDLHISGVKHSKCSYIILGLNISFVAAFAFFKI